MQSSQARPKEGLHATWYHSPKPTFDGTNNDPDVLISHLRVQQIGIYINTNVLSRVPGSRHALPLSLGPGEPLIVDAFEVSVKNAALCESTIFQVCNNGRNTIQFSAQSPPIIPETSRMDQSVITDHIHRWLDCVTGNEELDWPAYCFLDPKVCWEEKMLEAICELHRSTIPKLASSDNGPHHTLQWAMKLTVLFHTMGNAFVVPAQAAQHLLHNIQNAAFRAKQAVGPMCPRAATMLIKMIMLPMLAEAVREVLTGLDKLLRGKDADETFTVLAFSTVFLCLMAIGTTQRSIVERAAAGHAYRGASFTMAQAGRSVQELEDELSHYLIGMFHHKFCARKRGQGRLLDAKRTQLGGDSSESRFLTTIKSLISENRMFADCCVVTVLTLRQETASFEMPRSRT